MSTPRNIVDTLCKSLVESPTDWNFDRFHAKNHKTGVQIWIANGIPFIEVVWPFNLSFGILQKYRICTAIRYAKEKQLQLKFSIS